MKKILVISTILMSIFCNSSALAITASEAAAQRYLASIIDNPEKLKEFVSRLPKGGDLYNNDQSMSLAEIAEHAASQNQIYVETSLHFDDYQTNLLHQASNKWDSNIASMHALLVFKSKAFQEVVSDISSSLDSAENVKSTVLGCAADPAKPACKVVIRYTYIVDREQPPEMFFAQLVAGYEAAEKDNRIVAINMSAPPTGVIATRDSQLQKNIMDFLAKHYENNPTGLPVTVIFPFSNDQEYTLPTHFTSASNDMRVIKSNQFYNAIQAKQFDYMTLKNMVRNSIHYSLAYTRGRKMTMWEDAPTYQEVIYDCSGSWHKMKISRSCQSMLDREIKRTLEMRLEQQFDEFESTFTSMSN